MRLFFFFFFQAEDGIRDYKVTGVQTCALPIFAIQAFYNEEEGFEPRFGIAHFGFVVPESKAAAERVVQAGATVTQRPARRTQSEIRMRDPDGNGCDLSQRGWEVDVDKWVRAD